MGVTDVGLAGVSDALKAQFTHFAVGTDSTAFSSSQTSLGAETDTYNSLTTSSETTTTTDDTARFEGTYVFGSSKTLREVALFDAGSGGKRP